MIRRRLSIIMLFCLIAFSCSRTPYYRANKSYKKQAKSYAKTIRTKPEIFPSPHGNAPYWVGTTNFNLRRPNYVIIHHTAQNSCEQTLQTFTKPAREVSAHYVICKDGTLHHMLNDYLRAWHGGVSKWGNTTDINSSSIGIEIDNNGVDTFAQPQMNTLLTLLDTLKRRYNIPVANFIGHADIAPVRKVDPNITFQWKILAEHGFGLWPDGMETDTLPANFNSVYALKIVGYDVRDSLAAMGAFKRKFLQQNNNSELTNDEKKRLYSLMKKSL